MTLGGELTVPNTMNSSRLWLTWMTHGYELKALDAMSSSKLLMI